MSGIAVHDAAQRLAEAGGTRAGVGNLVVLALVGQRRLARQRLADDLDVFLGAAERLAVGHAVPALDHLRPGRTDAEQEPPAGQRIQRHRGHRGTGRRARLHLHDRGARLDPRGARQHPGDRRHRIGAPGLARPHRDVAETFGLQHFVHAELRRRAVDAHRDAKLHRALSFYRTFAITSSRKRRMLSIVASTVAANRRTSTALTPSSSQRLDVGNVVGGAAGEHLGFAVDRAARPRATDRPARAAPPAGCAGSRPPFSAKPRNRARPVLKRLSRVHRELRIGADRIPAVRITHGAAQRRARSRRRPRSGSAAAPASA